MDSRLLFFIASLALAGSASATGTGPTLPEKAESIRWTIASRAMR